MFSKILSSAEQLRKEPTMAGKFLMTAEEVAEELGISIAYAYRIIKEMNEELKAKGYHTINGKVSRLYFHENFYGMMDAARKEA